MERDQASKFINDLLKLMVSRNGSDLFITAEFPPAIKVDGKVTKVSPQPLTPTHTLTLARAVMSDKQVADFERTKECNFAISPAGIGRFRVNAFVQQGRVGMVLRTIVAKIPNFDELGLPGVLKDVVMAKRGLIMVVGGTGSTIGTLVCGVLTDRMARRDAGWQIGVPLLGTLISIPFALAYFLWPQGTAFYIGRNLLLTAAHVVDGQSELIDALTGLRRAAAGTAAVSAAVIKAAGGTSPR